MGEGKRKRQKLEAHGIKIAPLTPLSSAHLIWDDFLRENQYGKIRKGVATITGWTTEAGSLTVDPRPPIFDFGYIVEYTSVDCIDQKQANDLIGASVGPRLPFQKCVFLFRLFEAEVGQFILHFLEEAEGGILGVLLIYAADKGWAKLPVSYRLDGADTLLKAEFIISEDERNHIGNLAGHCSGDARIALGLLANKGPTIEVSSSSHPYAVVRQAEAAAVSIRATIHDGQKRPRADGRSFRTIGADMNADTIQERPFGSTLPKFTVDLSSSASSR